MKVLDGNKSEVMHLQRPCTCSGFCGPHFPELLEVSAPPGQVIGKIEEDLNYPQFLIKNSMDDTILRIEGPLCTYPCGGNVEFQVNPNISHEIRLKIFTRTKKTVARN